ncbi:hypothetical protein ACQ4PT_049785 [Festuca glaucescens]
MMPPGCWLLVFVWAWWLLPLMLAGAQQQQAEGCPDSATKCGNFTIAYPFWPVDLKTGRSCGHRDFGVVCHNNTTPVLRGTEILGFAIIQMNYEEQSLHAIDLGKLKLLNDSDSCGWPLPTWNTSTKLGRRFQISNTNQNLIMYNCTTEAATEVRGDRELVETRLRCLNQSEMLVGAGGRYDEASDYGGHAIEGCDTCFVPVLGLSSSGEANVSDYEQLIRGGFLMTWENPRRKLAPSNHLSLKYSFIEPSPQSSHYRSCSIVD